MRVIYTFLASLVAISGCARPTLATFETILDRQAAAWNRGDIDGFMDDYWKSDDLSFSSGGSTTLGWKATYDRYKTRYDTPDKMGKLSFDQLTCHPIASTGALVRGNWHLSRTIGDLGGNFSLVFERIGGRWVIIHDHTSVRP